MTAEDVLSGRTTETVQVGPRDEDIPYGTKVVMAPKYSKEFRDRASMYTPAWWVSYLLRELDKRNTRETVWNDYYEGDQPLAFASERFREAFGGRFRAFTSNFCALVVDGTRERMEVTGFDFGGARRNDRAWRMWQRSKMDARSQMAHTEALVKSRVFALVTPDRLNPPRITVEQPSDAIVATDPQDDVKRLAGLKRYVDYDGHLIIYLYLPETVWRLRSTEAWSAMTPDFTLEPAPEPGEMFPLPNPLGLVPLVELPNRPRLGGKTQSEVGPVMSNQDAINKYRADALVAAEFGAFRQRWATGLDIPEDPETGQPIEPFKSAVDRLWVVPPPDPEMPNPQETKFGEFSQTDLAPYQLMIESEIGAMSSISRMPYHYLLGQPQSVPPSGESLKSSEAGLISKVRTQLIHFGEGWEEIMRLALIASGDEGARDREAMTLWRDPETRNEGVRTDSTVKAYGSGIIDRNEARVALGYQPVQEDAQATPAPPTSDGVTY